MSVLLFLEPSRIYVPDLFPPLGALTLRSYLLDQGLESSHVDLVDLLPGLGISPESARRMLPEVLASRLIGALEEELREVEWVAFSITFQDAYPLSRALAELVAARHPGKRIVAGGRHLLRLHLHEGLEEAVDQPFPLVVLFDGEEALAALLRGAPLETIPNLVRRERGRVVVNPIRNDLPLEEIPLVLGADKGPIFPYEISRGCYWHGCRFCEYNLHGENFPYREKPIEAIAEDLTLIMPMLGRRSLFLVTDSLSLSLARSFSELVLSRGYPLSWYAFMRFEEGLDRELLTQLRDSGCVRLLFGLESGSPRVNEEVIHKGVRLEVASRILRDCHDLGILPFLTCLTGLPTETLGEALETFRFLHRHQGEIHQSILSLFNLCAHSEYMLQPEKFGILASLKREDGYEFLARRGGIYRHLLMRPFALFMSLYFGLFSEIDFNVPRRGLLASLTGRVLDSVVRRDQRIQHARRSFGRIRQERLMDHIRR